jgi:hypothetical protein
MTAAGTRKPAARTRASATAAWTAVLPATWTTPPPALVMLAQPARKPMTPAISAAQSAGGGVMQLPWSGPTMQKPAL